MCGENCKYRTMTGDCTVEYKRCDYDGDWNNPYHDDEWGSDEWDETGEEDW